MLPPFRGCPQGQDAVLLVPKESLWNTFMDGVNSFTEDIFENGRDQGGQEERDSL